MSGATSAVAAAAAVIGAGSAAYGALKGGPKPPAAPAPVATPPTPTVNDARQSAYANAQSSQQRGLLANMISPIQAAGSTNTSLKTLLGQ